MGTIRTTSYRFVFAALTGGALLMAAACGNSGSSTPSSSSVPSPTASASATSPGTTAGAAGTLTISNFTFSSLTVAPGTVVTVKNMDSAPHTVTGDGFDSGTVAPGTSGTFKAPAKPGKYPIHCTVHPQMSGVLTVS